MSDRLTPDQLIACLLLPAILPILAVLHVVVVALQGRPFLYVSERMRDGETAFSLYKIRTMRSCRRVDGETVLGGAERLRVTRIGAVLRRTRLDELPQIFNVLRGDIRFIGPRPPLRRHVAAYPEAYGRLLRRSRPGITGLATVTVHAREERILSRCNSVAESEEVYLRRCLPVKLRLDMLYARRRSLALDALILWRTFSRLARLPARRVSAAPAIVRPMAAETEAAGAKQTDPVTALAA